MNQDKKKQQFPEVFPHAKWTVILLINGENDLMKEVEEAYNQLARVGSCLGDVNFVVIFDGLTINEKLGVMHRSCSLEDQAYPNVYYVTKYRNLTTTAQPYRSYRDKDNLAKPGNLELIIREAVHSFPADHFGFIYKGHGGAGRTDIVSDIFRVDKVRKFTDETDHQLLERLKERAGKKWELDANSYLMLTKDNDVLLAIYKMIDKGDYRELTYASMRNELENAGFKGEDKLSFLCLDCCWGQIMENAEIFSNTTKYLIGSADEMPVMGIGYEEFADFLVKNRDIRPDELANGIVAVFFKNNYDDYMSSPKWEHIGVSLTCVDLEQYQRVGPKVTELCNFLIQNIEPLYLVISMARHVCLEYTNDLNPSDYGIYNIDLIWFLENLGYFNDEIGKICPSEKYRELSALITSVYQSLYGDFISSHMSSNYDFDSSNYGQAHMGGNGIGLTFPKDPDQLRNSLYGRPNTTELKIPVWEQFLTAYATTHAMVTAYDRNFILALHVYCLSHFYTEDVSILQNVVLEYMRRLSVAPVPKWEKKSVSSANEASTGAKSPADKKTALAASRAQNVIDPSLISEFKKTGVKMNGNGGPASTLRQRV